MKTIKTTISNFYFTAICEGCYEVTYANPATFNRWRTITFDMAIIDATYLADEPTHTALNALKALCKGGQSL